MSRRPAANMTYKPRRADQHFRDRDSRASAFLQSAEGSRKVCRSALARESRSKTAAEAWAGMRPHRLSVGSVSQHFAHQPQPEQQIDRRLGQCDVVAPGWIVDGLG